MSGSPALHVRVGAEEWLRLEAPPFGARAWLLGVVAVQLAVERGRVTAQARAHATGGAEPIVRELASPAELHVTLVPAGTAPPPAPALPPQNFSPPNPPHSSQNFSRPEFAATLSLFLDSKFVDEAALAPAALAADPPARGFGHVFCRWLRSGAIEPGFDLTDFLSQPPGRKFERRLVRPLAPGQIVSYRFVSF